MSKSTKWIARYYGISNDLAEKIFPKLKTHDFTSYIEIKKFLIQKSFPLPDKIRELVLKRDGHTCHYCKNKLVEGSYSQSKLPTVDHIIPRGNYLSTEHLSNLVASCLRCNSAKGNVNYYEFMIKNGYASFTIQN